MRTPMLAAAAADGGEGGEPEYDAAARAKIEEMIKGNKIVLFMKGTRCVRECILELLEKGDVVESRVRVFFWGGWG
jgi:hypothetical protein